MKIALIGDIHANLPALDAVLEDAARWKVEQFWNIGDFVGYGPYPNEVIERCREMNALSVVGNYDRKVLRFAEKEEKWSKKKQPEKMAAFRWAAQQLSPANSGYLHALPEQRVLEIYGWQILIIHSSPADPKEHLCPETPAARFEEIARLYPYDLIICGHSHQPFVCKAGDTWFINTGSVGRPDDGDPRAGYAVLDLLPGSLSVEHQRVTYPVDQTVQAVRDHHLPEDYAQMFLQGVNLEDILRNKTLAKSEIASD